VNLEFFILVPLGAGLAASLSPCVLPLYPGFLAYVAGSSEALKRGWVTGLLVLAGVVSFMLALGLLVATLAVPTSVVNLIAIPLSATIVLLLGILLLCNVSVFERIPTIQLPGISNPYANAYFYGVLYGPVSFPCSAAFAISVFTLAVTATEFGLSVLAFLMFGLGLGIPLLVIAILGQRWQLAITRFFARNKSAVNRVSGALLVAVAVLILYDNREFLLASSGLIAI
jgi:cytochrome c-type biogenesis protein